MENNNPIQSDTAAEIQKKPAVFQFAVSIATIVVFLAIILTPLVLLIFTGQDKTVLEGEKQYTPPAFSIGSYFNADFQSDFELWFSTKYPLRSNLVTAYRQLQFDSSNIGFDISMLFASSSQPKPSETEPSETTEVEEPKSPYSDFNPLYTEMNRLLYERTPVESSGYKGTDQVVIGKSGYCYENGYINELLGYSPKYRHCDEEYIAERIEKLTYIQTRLKEMGIEFTLIISPSKAAEYAQYIPDWYKAQNTTSTTYVRPVDMLRKQLAETDLNYIDCAALYDEIGLDETFPLTGIHWNKPAAYEASKALIEMYEKLSGTEARRLAADSISSSPNIPSFGNGETDIFGIAYSGFSARDAITDDLYYWPDVYVENDSCQNKINLLLQGGSFCWDFKYYFQNYNVTNVFKQFYYNGWQGKPTYDPFGTKRGNGAWEELLKDINYVVFECNEQFVCTMATNAPSWGAADRAVSKDNGNDVYESLYTYLKGIE